MWADQPLDEEILVLRCVLRQQRAANLLKSGCLPAGGGAAINALADDEYAASQILGASSRERTKSGDKLKTDKAIELRENATF